MEIDWICQYWMLCGLKKHVESVTFLNLYFPCPLKATNKYLTAEFSSVDSQLTL